MLDHRRETDRRLDASALDVVLQQQAFQRRTAERPAPRADLVVDLRDPEPVVDLDRCPLCGVLFDRLWLFRHVALDH